MSDYLLALGVMAVGFVPVWKIYAGPAWRGDFPHASTCYCNDCRLTTCNLPDHSCDPHICNDNKES